MYIYIYICYVYALDICLCRISLRPAQVISGFQGIFAVTTMLFEMPAHWVAMVPGVTHYQVGSIGKRGGFRGWNHIPGTRHWGCLILMGCYFIIFYTHSVPYYALLLWYIVISTWGWLEFRCDRSNECQWTLLNLQKQSLVSVNANGDSVARVINNFVTQINIQVQGLWSGRRGKDQFLFSLQKTVGWWLIFVVCFMNATTIWNRQIIAGCL